MGRLQLVSLLLLAVCFYCGWALRCPYGGWMSYGGNCYYFYNANYTRTWADSRQRCNDQDADLVTISTTGERDWLLRQVAHIKSSTLGSHHNFWTGINMIGGGSAWKGPNNTNVNISLLTGKWAHGQPHQDNNHQCVEIRDNTFYVDNCRNSYQAICKRPFARPLTCDPGWTLFSGMCYKYFGSVQNYNGAKSVCHRNGGVLPQVFDSGTQTALWDMARTRGQNLWLSLKSVQQGHSYVWKWDNGTVLGHSAYWNRNPPASLGRNVNNTCVEQSQTQPTLKSWNPTTCNSRRSFYCQKPEGSCPDGWLQITNRCYLIYTHDAKPFSAAQSYCHGLGGNLAALDSSDTTAFLWPYIHNARAAGAYTIWIGLTDYNQNAANAWKWVYGNRTLGRWHNWPGNHVTNTQNRQDCVTIDSSDHTLKWHATPSCGQAHRFICQLPVNRPLRVTTAAPQHYTCPRGFILYQSQQTCIQLNSHDSTWDQARQACQAKHSDLVIINDNNFKNFINAQIHSHRGKYWIGLHDRHHEGRFEWLDTSHVPTYKNWHSGQPNNLNGQENCVAIYDQGSNYQWWDMTCSTKYHFICQARATRSGQPITTTTQKPWSSNCGPFWEDDPNSFSCYMFNTERLSWLDARGACQAHGGDLVSVNSVSEQFYLNGRVQRLGSNFFWIGANDRQSETGWRWSDQSAFAFVNWRPSEPNNQGNSDCVGISKTDGQWSDFKCTDRYGYICEKMGKTTPRPTRGPTSPATVPNGKTWGCQRGWRGFSGQCYQFSVQRGVSWQSARTKCGQRGGVLVSIHSDAENKFVMSLFPSGNHGNAWIGLNDLLLEGSFAWSDTTAVTYTHWNNREPNNYHNSEDCVALNYRGGWIDYSCTASQVTNYVCKKPMSLQNTADIAMLQGCSSGLGFRAQCYAYITTPIRNWNDAQADCRHRHGNLATVNDRQVQAFVAAELVYRGGQGYWIGLKNAGSNNNTYVWSTNYDVDYTSWSEAHTGNEHGTCVGMTTGRPVGLWKNYPCNTKLPYICELPRRGFTTPPPTPPTTTSRLPCPPHWRAYRNLCMKAFNFSHSDRLSWMESRDYCRSLGGDLTSIWNRNMERYIISRVLNNATSGIWWIGLNDRDSEMGHVWSDDHGVDFTHWMSGEPNDYNNREDCVEWVFPNNGWNDDNCYVANNFICSIPRGVTLTTTGTPPTGVTNALCPNSTWIFLDGYCYYMSPESGPTAEMTWFDARRTCRHMHSELASVHGVDENGFLTSAMSKHSHWAFWLGLNSLDQNDYVWTDTTPVNFITWAPNEPNDAFGGEACVESTSTGLWNDQNCDDKNAFICKRPIGNAVPKLPTLAPATGGCPDGFTSIPLLEKCYKVAGQTDDTRKNYTDAATACQNMVPSATLLSVHTFFEQRYVMTLIAKMPHFVWIGLNDRKRRNYFEWHDNSEMTYTHWGPGQPDENVQSNNPDDRRDCVAMNPTPRYAGNWNDMNCRSRFHYICQIKRVATLSTLQPQNTNCHAGYSNHQGNCYKYFSTPQNWQTARSTCQHDGGDLVTITDRFQVAVVGLLRVSDRRQFRNVSDIWIGLNMPQGGKSFVWSSGWPVRMTKWADGEPDDSAVSQGLCVKMDNNSRWNDQPCTSSLPFVCEILKGPPPTTTTVNGACPSSSGTWSAHGEYCYQLVTTTPRSWPEARYDCAVLGGALASVHSTDEMNYVTSLLSQASSSGLDSTVNVWIGLSKGLGDGFSWTDQTELEYDNWDQQEPSDTDNSQHQDCVLAAISSGKWNDVDCFDANYYLCKALQVAKTSLATGPTMNGGLVTQPGGNPQTQRPGGNPQTQPGGNPQTQRPGGNPQTQRPGGNPQTQRPGGNPQTPYNPRTPYNPGTPAANTNRPGQVTPVNTQGFPQTQRQTGSNSGGGGGGLSGGGVAAIVIGVLAFVGIVGIVVFFNRDRLRPVLSRSPRLGGDSGFDNALYSKTSENTEGAAKGSVSFGFDGGNSES